MIADVARVVAAGHTAEGCLDARWSARGGHDPQDIKKVGHGRSDVVSANGRSHG